MKKKILFALAAAAVLISRRGFEKSFRYEDHTGIEHELCFTVTAAVMFGCCLVPCCW